MVSESDLGAGLIAGVSTTAFLWEFRTSHERFEGEHLLQEFNELSKVALFTL